MFQVKFFLSIYKKSMQQEKVKYSNFYAVYFSQPARVVPYS